jgi:hypothetical protein
MGVSHNESRRKVAFEHAVLVLAVVLAIQVSFVEDPRGAVGKFATSITTQLANVVGMTAGVAPNSYNSLAQEFDRREAELLDKELEIAAREESLKNEYLETLAASNRRTVLVLSSVIALLVILIGTNFYLDWKRGLSLGTPRDGALHKDHSEAAEHRGEFQTRL